MEAGRDYPALGRELYRDKFVRIVESGGIPVYSAVGYSSNLGYGVPAEVICGPGPGTGLKTFDRLYVEQYEPEFHTRFTDEERARLAKGFNSDDEPTDEDYNLLSNVDQNAWTHTGTLPKWQRASERFKLKKSGVRITRFYADPEYGSHVYLRAPMCWPWVDIGSDRVGLAPNLMTATLSDYHGGRTYEELLAGAETGETMDVGVVIQVDPDATMVFNSNARIDGLAGNVLTGSAITLTEYLLRLRACGVGHVEPQFEVYATPPDGLLSSSTFSACISRQHSTFGMKDWDPTYRIRSRNGSVVPGVTTASPVVVRLRNESYDAAYKRSENMRTFIDWYNKKVFPFVDSIPRLANMRPTSKALALLAPYMGAVQSMATSLLPFVNEIHTKLLPYVSLALSVLTPELYDAITAATVAHAFKAGSRNMKIHTRFLNETLKESVDALDSLGLRERLTAKKKTAEEQAVLFSTVMDKTPLGHIMYALNQLRQRKGEFIAFLDGLPPAPRWAPPASAATMVHVPAPPAPATKGKAKATATKAKRTTIKSSSPPPASAPPKKGTRRTAK